METSANNAERASVVTEYNLDNSLINILGAFNRGMGYEFPACGDTIAQLTR